MEIINIKTGSKEELQDITHYAAAAVKKSGVMNGVCLIYAPHTTAAITINENADRSVMADIIKGVRNIGLEELSYSHLEGNSPAHIKSSLFGCSESVIISGGDLQLGTWQGIFFCEFDGPRSRKFYIQITGE